MNKLIEGENLREITRWVTMMQDGDKIVRHGNTITIYNYSGCDLDSIQL